VVPRMGSSSQKNRRALGARGADLVERLAKP
jgi:hypothetical protein